MSESNKNNGLHKRPEQPLLDPETKRVEGCVVSIFKVIIYLLFVALFWFILEKFSDDLNIWFKLGTFAIIVRISMGLGAFFQYLKHVD